MALWACFFTVPAGTPEDSPATLDFEVEGELLRSFKVIIPDGHAALCRLAIFYGVRQLAPRPQGAWIRGNDHVIEWEENWEIPEGKAKLTFVGWNEDDTYPHTFDIYLVVVERAPVPAWARLLLWRRR